MLRVAVVGCHAALVTFCVADDNAIRQRVKFELLAQIGEQFHGVCIGRTNMSLGCLGVKVYPRTAAGVLDGVRLGHLNADVGIVCRATCVPATIVPREGLIYRIGFNERMNGFLYASLVPTLDEHFGFRLGSANGMDNQTLGTFILKLLVAVVDASQVIGIHIVFG